jgi:hypothetical protein
MMKRGLDGDNIFVIPDFLTGAECTSFITASEQAGYEEATISTLEGPSLDKEVRDNARLIRDDPALAAAWWQRAKPFLPLRIKTWEAVGFNVVEALRAPR